MKELVNVQIYTNEEGINVVSSRVIAEELGKRHDNIMRDLDKIINEGVYSNLRTPQIIESFYINEQNKQKYREYLLTKDGFILYVMNIQGYNDFKMAYINKFNEMERQLKEQQAQINQKDKLLLDLFSDDELKDILNTSEGFRDFMKLTTIKIQKQKLERWKDIENYEGLYRISSLGRVKSLNYNHTGKAKIMKPSINKYGYLGINLCKDGKMKKFYVHRLVAQAFISNDISERDCIDHINTIKTDNRACNLKWVTPKENSNNPLTREKLQGENHPMYGRTGEKNGMARKVRCLETNQIFNTLKEAGEWCGLKGLTSIINQLKGRARSAGKHPITKEKLHWEYVDEETIETNLNLSLISNITISL